MFLFRMWNLIIITNYSDPPVFLYVLGGCCYTCWSQICSLADHLFILCVQVPGRELLLHLADHLCILCVQVLGRELLLHLADHLCTSYLAGDPDTRKLVDSTRIHLIPSMNPDGWKIATENVSQIIFFVISKNKCYIC